MRRRSLALVLASGLTVSGLALLPTAFAAPGDPSVTVPPAAGGTASAAFSGTVPTGADPDNACSDDPLASKTTVTVTVPTGTYDSVDASAIFKITWEPVAAVETSDEILTVLGPDGTALGSSDGGAPVEQVTLSNPVGGDYTVLACGFANAQPQPYDGTVTITSSAKAAAAGDTGGTGLPTVDPQGLSFGATVAADIQRSESEPNMEIDAAGNIYTCGPTGFSNANDYAQVSTDGGDQFHLLGTPPRGQQGTGGGGDCGLATSAFKNAAGNFTYSYTGLGPLTGFTTSSSDDVGQTLKNGGPQGNADSGSGALVDRQWQVFTDPKTVLLSYNQQVPRNVVIQRSDDGGVTYGVNGVIAAPNPLFPGPLRILTADLNPYKTGKPLVYFPWNNSENGVNLSISPDAGATWTMCTVGKADGSPRAGFMTADNDTAGNVYLAYADDTTFGTYLSTISNANLMGCDQPVANNPLSPSDQPAKNPGWTTPIQVNRGSVATTVFPWLVAGGEPGRVAIAYYGTETVKTDGLTPATAAFKASWDVYVSQSLNGLAGDGVNFGQVKATTHPMHYDSICLSGLGCSLSTPAGDRSLGDFFALDYNPVDHKLSLVYDQGSKRPDDATGAIATPAALTQNAGPSNGGAQFDFGRTPARPALRTSSVDPQGDALSSYSFLTTPVGGNPTTRANEPASDVLSHAIGLERDADGKAVSDGGFSVTMKIADLSDGALAQTMANTESASLLWIWRFVDGYRASAISARYNLAEGFTFGYNGYVSNQCGGGNCLKYPGNTPIAGSVDQEAGTITLSVPRALLKGLKGSTGPGERPAEVPATVGTRFYDGAVFTVGNTQPTQENQSFLYPLDNSPSMDFLLPGQDRQVLPSILPTAGGTPTASGSASPSSSASSSSSPGASGSADPSASPTGSASGTATAGRFHPLTPSRIYDSRDAPNTRIAAGNDRRVQVTGQGGIPTTGVSAVVLNITEVLGSARGDLQVYPTGQKPADRTSNLNYFRGQAVPVQVQLGVGDGGGVNFSVNTGSADVIVDVFGYYGSEGDDGGSGYTALQPQRLLDTRDDGQEPVVAGEDQTVQVSGRLGVPATATAVTFNATLLGTPANADLQIYPTGNRPQERTSNLNVARGLTKANSVTTPLGSSGQINLSISQNRATVVLDVLGYYSADSPGRFIALQPQRIFDTRTDRDKPAVAAGSDRSAAVRGQGGVPARATAAVLSTTATGASQSLDLQVFPTGNRPTNRTSTLNLRPAEAVANLAVATLGSDGSVTLSVSRSQAQTILDVVGYFTN